MTDTINTYSEKYEWQIDYSWQLHAGILPALFLFWIWYPYYSRYLSPAHLFLLMLACLAGVGIIQFLSISKISISSEGISFSKFKTHVIPWNTIEAIRLSKVFGTYDPSVVLVLNTPFKGPLLWKKQKVIHFAIPALPSIELYRLLRNYLEDYKFDAKLTHFIASAPPFPQRRILLLITLQLALVAFWVTTIFRGQDYDIFNSFSLTMICLITVLLVFFAMLGIIASLRWYEAKNPLRTARHVFVKGSFYILFLFFLGLFDSDIYRVVSIYVYLWFLVVLAVFDVLELLTYFFKSVSPYWSLCLLFGFFLYPGQDLLWQYKHMDTLAIPSEKIMATDKRIDLKQYLVWPDGRIVVSYELSDKNTELLFINAKFKIIAKTTVPQGSLSGIYGDWAFIVSGKPKERCYYYQQFGENKEYRMITDIGRLFFPLDPNRIFNHIFAYNHITENEMEVFRINLSTGAKRRLFQITGSLKAVQIDEDTLVWAQRDEENLQIHTWSARTENTEMKYIPLKPGIHVKHSPDFSHLAISQETGTEFTIIRVEDEQAWTLPVNIRAIVWSLPYVACFPIDDPSARIFKLQEDGRIDEIHFSSIPIEKIAFSQDNRYIIFRKDRMIDSTQVLYDFQSSRQRKLFFYQNLVSFSSEYLPYQSPWSRNSFYYLTHSGLSNRSTLIRIFMDE